MPARTRAIAGLCRQGRHGHQQRRRVVSRRFAVQLCLLLLLFLHFAAMQDLCIPRAPLSYGVMWARMKAEDVFLERERVDELVRVR